MLIINKMNNNSTNSRVYPIRTTRPSWKIPLHCSHLCSNLCEKTFVQVENEIPLSFCLIDNPDFIDGKCSRFGCIERTAVPISSYDVVNPSGYMGKLYEPNKIVIPDPIFKVYIYFPLNKPIDLEIHSSTSLGFSLKELLQTICKVYKEIYAEEERTATPVTYNLRKICNQCNDINLADLTAYITEPEETPDGECSICYTTFDSSDQKVGQLPCNHYFHRECMIKWLEEENSGENCPLCRRKLYICSDCNGSKYIYYDFHGTVIPMEHRGHFLNRNTTNGRYGIWGHDLEDLVIEEMFYDKLAKRLTVFVGS
jgi:hypothetical protein